jgi:hypothetical protein
MSKRYLFHYASSWKGATVPSCCEEDHEGKIKCLEASPKENSGNAFHDMTTKKKGKRSLHKNSEHTVAITVCREYFPRWPPNRKKGNMKTSPFTL